jgi:hypothetical protein
MIRRYAATFLGTLLLASLVTGCGPSDPPGTMVTGRIVENGEPIPAPRADVGVGIVEIELHPVGDPAGRSVEATSAKGDGTFLIVGLGSGMAPGEYEVALFKRESDNQDYFKGKFAKGKSPIRVTIPAEKAEHDLGDIDVAKY